MSRTLMAAENEGPSLTEERRKALNLAITQIEKTCGKGAIMRMGADSPRVRVEAIPTGAINLDAAIGIGGIDRIVGSPSSSSSPTSSCPRFSEWHRSRSFLSTARRLATTANQARRCQRK